MKNPTKNLNASVATHLLGWRNEGGQWLEPGSDMPVPLPSFNTDISLAWKLADRVCEKGFRLQVDGSRIWQARFYKSASHTLETHAFAASARNPAEAICLAALAVEGIVF